VKPGHSLEGAGSSRVELTDSVPRGSVTVGGGGHGDVSVSVAEVAGLSAPLAVSQTLGRPGHEGGGSGVSVSVSGVSVSVGSKVGRLGLSISAPLAVGQTLGRPGHEGGGGSWVSSNSGNSVSVDRGESVSVGEVARLGISTPLSSAAKAGGGREGGGHAGPVGVGVVDGGDTVVSVARFGLGLSLVETMDGLVTGARERSSVSRGIVRSVEGGETVVSVARFGLSLAGGDGDDGSSNQKLVHDDDDTTHCRVRAVVIIIIMYKLLVAAAVISVALS